VTTADTTAVDLGEMLLHSQPVSNVRWVPRDNLSANAWNPNRAAPPEFRLLKVSLLENGWTQPIVVREHDGGTRLEVVDGYHRWLASADPKVSGMTDGMVPVVVLPECDDDMAMMSTVRHNRARGSHGVLKMADIVAALVHGENLDPADVGRRLGMDEEEVERLLDRGVMTKRGAATDGAFGNGWTV
jgi:ParB-like chromosome segregation protein Spo0J